MAIQFQYKAIALDGTRREGVITVDTPQQVMSWLEQERLQPIRISPQSSRRSFSLMGFLRSSHYEDLIVFTNSLSTMYRAGIPILRALQIIRVGPKESHLNFVLDQMRIGIQSGKSLSAAMSEYSTIFSPVYVATIAAGEESGQLDGVLDELADVLEKELELGRQIKSGVRYPLIVVGVITAAFVVMITYVVPRFSEFYGSMGAQLPLATRILIIISETFARFWPAIICAFVAGGFILKRILSSEKGKLWFDRRLLKIPILGELALKGNVARFALLFRILHKSGLPLVKSLRILSAAVRNSAIGAEIRQIEQLFHEGKDSHLATAKFEFFPQFARHMFAIGFESGSLERMLEEVGAHYTKQVQYTSRQLTSILEPILTLVLGAFVLLMALAIFLPMWNLIKVFQGQ
ncbi:MAG: type II secretion system F family protein [Candidatus Zixiibacteriota bacterium]